MTNQAIFLDFKRKMSLLYTLELMIGSRSQATFSLNFIANSVLCIKFSKNIDLHTSAHKLKLLSDR